MEAFPSDTNRVAQVTLRFFILGMSFATFKLAFGKI